MTDGKQQFDKVTVRLYAGDAAELANFYPNVGYNKALRQIVRQHLKTLREKASAVRGSVDIKEL